MPRHATTARFDRIDMPKTVWRLAISGRTRFHFHQYGDAQTAFAEALVLDPPKEVRSIILSCYATCGYLALLQSTKPDEAESFIKGLIEEFGPAYDEGYEEMLRFLRGD